MIVFLKISLLSAFVIIFISISGIREYLQIRSNKFFYKLLSCDFCLSFWINLIVSLCYITYTKSFDLWYMPIVLTPITRKLL